MNYTFLKEGIKRPCLSNKSFYKQSIRKKESKNKSFYKEAVLEINLFKNNNIIE